MKRLIFGPKMIAVISVIMIAALFAPTANAAYVTTGFLTDLDIFMDNGKTYFGNFIMSGNCLYNRLLRDTGDYSNSIENGKRMYAFILAARFAGKPIKIGYNDTDGPACRLFQVVIQW